MEKLYRLYVNSKRYHWWCRWCNQLHNWIKKTTMERASGNI